MTMNFDDLTMSDLWNKTIWQNKTQETQWQKCQALKSFNIEKKFDPIWMWGQNNTSLMDRLCPNLVKPWA